MLVLLFADQSFAKGTIEQKASGESREYVAPGKIHRLGEALETLMKDLGVRIDTS
jgi:hypothetical protein